MPIGVSGVSVKEVVEMIESRIPGGRYVISVLLCLLVVTAATACGAYLYHSLLIPSWTFIFSLVTTGKVVFNASIGGLIGSVVGSVFLYMSGHYMQKTVLVDYKKVDSGLGLVLETQGKIAEANEIAARAIKREIELLTIRVSALEQRGKIL